MDIEEEPQFSEASSPEHNLFLDMEFNKDLSELELSSEWWRTTTNKVSQNNGTYWWTELGIHVHNSILALLCMYNIAC